MDKEVLFKRKAYLDTDTVDLGGGAILTIRALTRGEVSECRAKAKGNEDDYEHRLMAKAIVDPELTLAEVRQWIMGDPGDPNDVGAPAGDAVKVITTISQLSGLAKEGAQKSVPGVRGGRRR